MAPAVAPFRAALDEVELREPRFTVFSCASAQPFADVREELAQALIRPVRWRETFTALHEAGAERFIEVGPGKVLARLAKRIVPGTKVETPAEELPSMPETTDRRATAADERPRAPMRTARILGLGHKLPDRVVAERPDRRAHRRRLGVDRPPDGHPRAPLRRARTSARPTSRVAAARRALTDAGLKAVRRSTSSSWPR